MSLKTINKVIAIALCILAVLAIFIAAIDAYHFGYPRPTILITALLLIGAAISWPLVSESQASVNARLICKECKEIVWGFSEFKFCMHCGSTKPPEKIRS